MRKIWSVIILFLLVLLTTVYVVTQKVYPLQYTMGSVVVKGEVQFFPFVLSIEPLVTPSATLFGLTTTTKISTKEQLLMVIDKGKSFRSSFPKRVQDFEYDSLIFSHPLLRKNTIVKGSAVVHILEGYREIVVSGKRVKEGSAPLDSTLQDMALSLFLPLETNSLEKMTLEITDDYDSTKILFNMKKNKQDWHWSIQSDLFNVEKLWVGDLSVGTFSGLLRGESPQGELLQPYKIIGDLHLESIDLTRFSLLKHYRDSLHSIGITLPLSDMDVTTSFEIDALDTISITSLKILSENLDLNLTGKLLIKKQYIAIDADGGVGLKGKRFLSPLVQSFLVSQPLTKKRGRGALFFKFSVKGTPDSYEVDLHPSMVKHAFSSFDEFLFE